MRTTLKRGTGRLDGNGHGTIPLTALSPVSRYQARRRVPLRLVGKVLLWILVVLLVAAGAAPRGGGGVPRHVDRRYLNDNSSGGPTYATIDVHAGYQHLNGSDALDFVRYRHTDSDLYRVVRQQEFVKAFKQQVSNNWSLFQLPGIVKAVTENVEVAKGGKQALDSDEVISYARLVYSLPAGNFQQVSLDNVSGFNELDVSETDLQAAVRRFMNPDVDASEKALAVATGRKPKEPETPPPSEITVEVQNGNGVAGAADEAAYLLGQIGYQTANGGNAQTFDYFHTTVLYDPTSEDGELAARAVADLFGDAEVEE